MKKIILFISLALSTNAFAQREVVLNLQNFESNRFNWGYYIGLSNWGFKLNPVTGLGTLNNRTTVETKAGMGFSVGLMGMININKNLDLRIEPGMHIVTRKLTFANDSIPVANQERTIKSSYIDLPFLVHFRGNRWNNIRPFAAAGAGYMRNLQSNEKSEDDNSKNTFRMKTNNFDIQGEAGVEIYFKHFKMSPSIKGIFMLNNEIVADNPDTSPYYAGGIDELKSRAFMVSLKFE